MPEIFGLDLAAIVDDSIVSAGGTNTGTLTKAIPGTRTPGDLIGGTNPTTTDYEFRGFIENKSQNRQDGTLVVDEGQIVSILGNSLPNNIEPETNDVVTIEGVRYTITAIASRDPAAALYECAVSA